jgi:alpha-ketoglutarate-dependent taurine dioxygenase
LHNENSYQHTFPLKVFFYCDTPAIHGGETPIADVRKVFQRIAPEIREKFITKGIMYVRNFEEGLGLNWQTVFQTTDKAVVEDYCREAGIQVEWKANNRLTTRQIRPAVAQHPKTGEKVWFNHGTFFHVSTLPESIRNQLLADYPEDELPNNTYYGDGSQIESLVMEELRKCYQEETETFGWQKGDVLMLDNMLVAHGRSPFEGARKILVGMAEPFSLGSFS